MSVARSLSHWRLPGAVIFLSRASRLAPRAPFAALRRAVGRLRAASRSAFAFVRPRHDRGVKFPWVGGIIVVWFVNVSQPVVDRQT